MGLLSWLIPPSAAERRHREFCSQEFQQMWGSFVSHFADVGFHGAPCATPEQAGAEQGTPTVLPAAERLVAVGDLHGDLGKARKAFRAAGLTDEHDRWVGGTTVAVQVGDQLDRGDEELRVLYFLENLQAQARQAGGALHVLNGNHETMNVAGNHRYATKGATHEIVRWNHWQSLAHRLRTQCSCSDSSAARKQRQRPPQQPPAALSTAEAQGMYGASHFVRTFALQPGSAISTRFFSWHPTVLQVGSTVFVHGGVLPHHVEYGLERINRETSDWLRGIPKEPAPDVGGTDSSSTASMAQVSSSSNGSGASSTGGGKTGAGSAAGRGGRGGASTTLPLPAPDFLRTSKAVVWARDYSAEDAARCDCDKLQQVLESIPGAARMVMGHTIQSDGINAACGGRALRVDVGMSVGCGDSQVEVLEVLQDGQQLRRLREGLPPEPVSVAASSDEPQEPPTSVPRARGLPSWFPSVVIPTPSAA